MCLFAVSPIYYIMRTERLAKGALTNAELQFVWPPTRCAKIVMIASSLVEQFHVSK